MKKTLMIAAALLTLGVGSAFAGDGGVNAQPAQVTRAAIAQQATSHNRLFSARTAPEVSVYSAFGQSGTSQGGEN